MIKVLLKNGNTETGDWDSASVLPRMGHGEVVAVTLELTGTDCDASFVLSEVIGWMKVTEVQAKVALMKEIVKKE